MFRQTLLTLLFLTSPTVFAQSPPALANLNPFFDKIWRIESLVPGPNSSSIYIFIRNGTVLETSCVETYRVATWRPSAEIPGQLIVTEDGRPAFTATVAAATAQMLNLHQVMLLGAKDARNLTLRAIDKEFVCPDMPK